VGRDRRATIGAKDHRASRRVASRDPTIYTYRRNQLIVLVTDLPIEDDSALARSVFGRPTLRDGDASSQRVSTTHRLAYAHVFKARAAHGCRVVEQPLGSSGGCNT
jgi:hypothetical protein